MILPKDDINFLDALGFPYRLEDDPSCAGAGLLIFDNFDVSGGGFAPARTTLMIHIPALYNTTPLDMWYCDPPIMINGQFPAQASGQTIVGGRSWQYFSRHLDSGVWRPGKDGLRSFFPFIFRELQGRG